MRVRVRSALATFVIALISLIAVPSAYAVKANPKPITRVQPDGTMIEVKMIGDERVVFNETLEGHTVVRDADGWWVYADPAGHKKVEKLKPTKMKVKKGEVPSGLMKHVRPLIDPAKLRIPFEQKDDGSIGELFRRNMKRRTADGVSVMSSGNPSALAPALTPTTVPVLVILVEFSDWAHTTVAGTPRAGEPAYQPLAGSTAPHNSAPNWQTLMDDPNVPGGLNHFYKEATYERFQWDVKVAQRGKGEAGSGTLLNDGWYVNPNTMKFWGQDTCPADDTDGGADIKGLIEWAIAAANPDVNYALYDTNSNGTVEDAELMIFVVHARQGQENYGSGCDGSDPNDEHIWSHKWNIDTDVTVDGVVFDGGSMFQAGKVYAIEPEFSPVFSNTPAPLTLVEKYFGVGVYAHEALHTLGATDIYDTGYDAVPAGEWDLMDSGSYNGAKSGTHPAHMGTPLKLDIRMNGDTQANSYGFILDSEITTVTSSQGLKSIAALGKGGNNATNVVHRMPMPNDANEFLMLENRAAVGYYEPFLPEHGILVWHRDLGGAVGNNSWPYEAAVERAGWNSTAAGLNAPEASAALSLDDAQTELTATSNPNNARNEETASGLLDVKCIGAEGATMTYVYGALSGANPGFAGSSVSGGTDSDQWIDNGESVTLAVKVMNSSCASVAAADVAVALTVAADSEIPASAVTIAPASASFGSINANSVVTQNFTVTLLCNAPGNYRGKSIKFSYAISGTNFTTVNGSFAQETDKDHLFFDDAEDGGATDFGNWTSTQPFDPSGACLIADGHGTWAWQNPSPVDRVKSGIRSYHTPETTASSNLMFTNPSEVWVSPNIPIPAGQTVSEMTFWHAAALPCPGTKTRGRVWISTNNGANWTRIESFFQDGGDLTWSQQAIDLSAFAGATQIKFLFTVYTYECWATGTVCNTSSEGWYIDDIALVYDEQGTCTACASVPTISNFTPTSGIPGTGVTITGTNFTGTTSVNFNGTSATYNVDSATQITTSVPAGATTGKISINTTTGCSVTSSSDFTVLCVQPGVPTLNSVTATGNNQLTVAWSAGSPLGATYNVYRKGGSCAAAGSYSLVASNLVTTNYVDNAVTNGNTYSYQVTSVSMTGCESAPTSCLDAVPYGSCTTPPTFAGLTSVTNQGCALLLQWPAATSNCPDAKPISYNIYRSVNAGASNLLASCVNGTFFTDTDVQLGSNYSYIVRAEDGTVGNGGVCNSGNTSTNNTAVGGSPTGAVTVATWLADADTNAPAMTMPSPWATSNLKSVSGNSYRAGPYGNDACSAMVSPSLKLASSPSSTLTFSTAYLTEAQDDGGVVDISTDGGTNWTRLTPTGGYPATTKATGNLPNCIAASNGLFSGTDTTFDAYSFNLAAYAGLTVRLRWKFSSDGNTNTGEGWYVDNISVTNVETAANCPVAVSPITVLTAKAASTNPTAGVNKLEWRAAAGATVEIFGNATSAPTTPSGSPVATASTNASGYGTANHSLTVGNNMFYSAFVKNGARYSAEKTVSGKPQDSTGLVKWTYGTGAASLAPPGIFSPGLYVVSNDRFAHGIKAASSGGDWSDVPSSSDKFTPYAMTGSSQGRPQLVSTVANPVQGSTRTLFVTAHDGTVAAINADSGAQLWKRRLTDGVSDLVGNAHMIQAPVMYVARTWTSPVMAADLVIFGTRNATRPNTVYGLNAQDGTTLFMFTPSPEMGIVSERIAFNPAQKRMFVGSRRSTNGGSQETLRALTLDPSNWSVIQNWALNVGDIDGATFYAGDKVYVGNNAGEVHVKMYSGTGGWSAPFSTSDGPVKGYVQVVGSRLYFSTTNKLWALNDNGTSGSLAWSLSQDASSVPLRPSQAVYTATTLPGGPFLIFGSNNGKLYKVGNLSGTPTIVGYQVGGATSVMGSPTVSGANSMFYVGSDSGAVYGVSAQ